MFEASTPGEYEPFKVRAKTIRVKKPAPTTEPTATIGNAVDQLMGGAEGTNGTADAAQTTNGEAEEEEIVYEEDLEDEEGAINPIEMGQITNMPALLALLTHIDNQLSPPIHSPVMVICDPSWTSSDKEQIAQFYFQTYSRPAIAMVDSALSIASSYGVQDALVIDLGKDKASVSAVSDFYVIDCGRQACIPGMGGMAINAALMVAREVALEQGKSQGPKLTYDMAEQLKKQPQICEILPFGTPLPMESAITNGSSSNPAAAASTGADTANPASAPAVSSNLPRGPGAGTQTGTDDIPVEDGVLDVAKLVVSGKTNEFLAKREQEQAAKGGKPGQKKGGAQEPPKPARIPNSQKAKVAFRYQERIKASELNGANGATEQYPDDAYIYQTKEAEIGPERFGGCNEEDLLWPIANAVLTVLSSAPVEKRNELASSIIIAGNGSKVKGLKDRIMSYLDTTIKISMSNASIFTSELPSNFSTPLATGANTPLRDPQSTHHGMSTPTPGPGSSVNPLLLAATTASQQQHHLAPPGSQPFQSSLQPGPMTPVGPQIQVPHIPHHAQQGPTAVRLVPAKDYFSEWKDHGMEEALFLGGQVMSRTIFSMDSGPQLNYMTRQNFNEEGPMGIHAYFLG